MQKLSTVKFHMKNSTILLLLMFVLIASHMSEAKSSGGRSSGGRSSYSSSRSSSYTYSSYATYYNYRYNSYSYTSAGPSGGWWWIILIIAICVLLIIILIPFVVSKGMRLHFCTAFLCIYCCRCKTYQTIESSAKLADLNKLS